MATNGPRALKQLLFNVFGRQLLVARENNNWSAYYLGDEGKRRKATDIVVPSDVPEAGLQQYLADLCHEWATEQSASVTRVK